MTTSWRLSVEVGERDRRDVVVDTTDDARVGDLVDELDHQGFDTYGLKSDGVVLAAGESLVTSPIRHGAVLGRNVPDPAPGPGWYLVSVAGPDTGTYHRIAGTPISVGRAAGNDLVVADSSLSGRHFTASVTDDGVEISDLGSTNGTTVEGDDVDGTVTVADEAYVHAGATTFGIVRIDPGAIPSEPAKNGPSVAFQRRFRDAERRLPDAFKHPTEPRESKESSRRPLISFAIPIVTAVGMAMITGRWIFLLVIGLGPIFYAIDGVRRRKLQAREFDAEVVDYQRRRDRLIADLGEARREELRRDRWTAAPAGLAALLAASRHERLWERSVNDDDFCEVAIGLHDRPSSITVDGRPDDATFPMDTQWSAVLRHSLVREGPLAVRGGLDRARALGRSILLDLATSHSPNDVKLWLLTDESLADDWNAVRWMPHTFLGDGQNRIFATPAARAAALSLLRSTIDERRREADGRSASALPVHVVVIDCVEALDPAELTDLLVDGAAVGVVGITIDSKVTPEGSNAELSLGRYSDEATFVSQTRPRVDRIRSVEMSTAVFERPTRAMSGCRPAGSARDDVAGSEVIRLVDLIDAETDPARADEVARRWSMSSGTSRIRVGGLGDLVTELDIVRDGPHGLVGGTTRSGKTEFLKSLITSLAVANHPDDLSIAIVDFKGGVDHELSARLPHVIDLSTNHDVDSFVRTVRLIEAEMQRRQRSFKQVGAPNFDAYRAARRSDPSLAPVPRLLVIVDEFSELLSSETGKENLSSLESVTRVGGGLGVHLLLVTQNFENQLPNQIAANAGMRICFRVQEAAHSKAVLNSPEAATIPKERIGRAFLRSHGGRAIEFQAARVAGPRPGKEVVAAAVQVRQVPFASLADAPPTEAIVDVPAEDTDMWAVVETLRAAAAASGWTAPAVPWPKELPAQVGIADVNRSPTATWPIGLVDEPELQRQSIVEFEPFGPHVLLLGGDSSALADVVRALTVSGAARRGPDRLQFYVLDQLGQGLGGLLALPHVGGVAERNEPLALRMLRHVATEVSRRKAKLSDLGVSNVSEYHTATGETLTEVVLVVHGADRILSLGESNQSLLLGPLIGLVSEAAGTGVRVVMTGPANIAHHRIGSSIGRRFVFELPDRQEYTAVGVPRLLHGSIRGTGRAVDVNRERLVQFALVPSSPDAPASEVVRAIGHRLTSEYVGPTDALPVRLSELPWPLPIRDVAASTPPEGVRHPVVLAVDTELGEVAWLDAEEDGPTFVVTGPTRSGRSTTLLAAAHLMRRHGWGVVALPVSRRSPLTPGTFPGSVTTPEDVKTLAESPGPVALFIDDAHRWTAPVDGLQAFLDGPGPRAVIMAGPTEFFGSRGDLTRALPARTALLLTPKSAMDGSNFGVRRIADEVLRDTRAGRGVLAVAGEVIGAQVPFVE